MPLREPNRPTSSVGSPSASTTGRSWYPATGRSSMSSCRRPRREPGRGTVSSSRWVHWRESRALCDCPPAACCSWPESDLWAGPGRSPPTRRRHHPTVLPAPAGHRRRKCRRRPRTERPSRSFGRARRSAWGYTADPSRSPSTRWCWRAPPRLPAGSCSCRGRWPPRSLFAAIVLAGDDGRAQHVRDGSRRPSTIWRRNWLLRAQAGAPRPGRGGDALRAAGCSAAVPLRPTHLRQVPSWARKEATGGQRLAPRSSW